MLPNSSDAAAPKDLLLLRASLVVLVVAGWLYEQLESVACVLFY
jgi:hypothetical protein